MNKIKSVFMWVKRFVICVWQHVSKTLLDIVGTCYDDEEFEVMSLPRLILFASFIMFVTAWIACQFFGKEFGHFDALVAELGTAFASYVGKKFVERPPK